MNKKWKKVMAGLCVAALGMSLFTPIGVPAQTVQARESVKGREILNFNSDWGFFRGDLENAEDPDYNDSEFAAVTLPHTMQLAKKHCPGANGVYQGIGWYRRYFTLDESYEGKKIQIQFEGVMTDSDVYLNGEKIYTRNGGYVGFTVDITDKVKIGETNVLALRVSKVDNPDTPPGKPEASLDFHYWGGIYRDVNMIVTEKTYVTDVLEADEVGGGGIFLTYPKVSEEEATVNVKADVANDNEEQHEIYVKQILKDEEGTAVVEQKSEEQTIAAGESYQFEQELTVETPHLWGIDDPYLYNLVTEVYEDGEKTDEVETNAGIRTIDYKSDGFYLNGERVYLRGANRHQAYQNVGDAAPNSMQYRDALQMKQNGFNAVRAAHYPQDPAFLDACDELGIVVVECQPGWQNFTNSDTFYDLTIRDTREMIRRDRNRPSVILWEASLNETNTSDQWAKDAIAAAREEYPGDQLFLASDYGYHGELYDVCYKVQDTRWSDDQDDWVDFDPEMPFFTREWGDWEGSSKALRKDGEAALNTQIYTRERYLNGDGYSDWGGLDASKRIGGHFLWSWDDYARGSNSMTLGSGTVDIDRYEKNGYYWFQSMQSWDNPVYGPMIYISSDYTEDSSLTVPVFSNCESVRLYQNGNLIKEISREEAGADVPNILAKGGSPIYDFELSEFAAGTLKAEGIVDGEVVCTHEVKTPGQAVKFEVEIGDRDVVPVADGSDLIPVYIKAVDENGTIVPDYNGTVHVEVSGNGTLVGEDIPRIKVQDQTLEKGIGFAFVRTSMTAGEIQVTATADEMEDSVGTVTTKKCNDKFVPDGVHEEWTKTEADLEEPEYSYDNIAIGKEVTVSTEQSENGNVKENLTDDDETSRWCASGGDFPQWAEVDLGSVYAISGFQMMWERSSAAYQYRIQVSKDRVHYETVLDMSANETINGALETQMQKAEGRYIRLIILGCDDGSWASLYEFKVIPDDEADDPEPGDVIQDAAVKDMEATSSVEGRGPEKLRDGVTEIGSGWLSESLEFPQSVTVHFKKPQTLLGSRIYWEKDSSWYTYDLEVTKDGKTWESVIHDLRVGGQHYKPETFEESQENVVAARVTIKNVEAGGVYQIGMAEWILYGYEYEEPKPEPVKEFEYLSDLEWTYAHSDYAQVTKNAASYGGNLVLNSAEGRKEFEKGLGADTNSEIRYTLEEGVYARFESYIGINANASKNGGEAIFRVYGDDELLYESPVMMRDDNCIFVQVDIENVKELKLEAVWSGNTENPEARYNTHIDWADAKIYTKVEEISADVLRYAVELAEKANTEGVIDSVLERFEKALENATSILQQIDAEKDGITQKMVDAAWQELISAMQYLSFQRGDKTDLEKVIAVAKTIDVSKYLDEGLKAFESALTKADNVFKDGDAMQDEVDLAWKELLKAMSELRLKPDKSALGSLIWTAKGLSVEGCSEELSGAFERTLAMAVSVYEDGQATEEEVTKATEDLQASVDQVLASNQKEGSGDLSTENKDQNIAAGQLAKTEETTDGAAKETTDTVKQPTSNTSAKTGDAAHPATAAAVLVLAAAAGIVAFERKRRVK